MAQMVNAAIQEIDKPKPEQVVNVAKESLNADEELNSEDDISDYNEELNCGKNMLIGFYVKSKRKKDKRKIHFKNCVLRIKESEYLVPSAKGEFQWAAASRGQR